MTTITKKTPKKSHAARTGVFVILGVIALGAALGYATGFNAPAESNAQIVVTAPPPVVSTPVTSVITSLLSTVIATQAPAVVVTARRDNGGDDHGEPCCTTNNQDEDDEVVVVATPEPQGNDDHGEPCCTTDIPNIGIDDHGEPCCTTPITPSGPTPPIIEIPRIPPLVEQPPDDQPGECIFLSASPGVITSPGQAVTLTWKTRDVDTVTINNGVGRVSPTGTGSVVVHPTGNTTYVATVTGGANSINCQASVRLETTHTDSPRCVDLSINKTRIEEGESAVLSWVTENASSIRINNGIGEVTPVRSGSITIHPREDTTYIATVPGAPDNPDCRVSVSIEEERERDHDRDDHDRDRDRERPEVFIGSEERPAEAPLASVYLSEIPYTGLDLGPMGTVVYWTMIVLWSGAAAYLVLFNFLPYLFRRAATDALAESGHLPGWGPTTPAAFATASVARSAAPAPAVHQAAHRAAVASALPLAQRSVVAAPAPAASRVYSPHEGFRSFASGGALTIDDIVKGLSRESDMDLEIAPVAPVVPAAPAVAPASLTARPEKNTTAYADDIPDFIEALISGDRDHVFGTVRNIAKQGGSSEDFLSEAVCALDDAYRARTEGGDVHPEIARVTSECHTSFLEKLIASLATALDSSYSAGVTGTKLALTRALAVVNG